MPQPPPAAMRKLRTQPHLKAAFDAKYGDGQADRALEMQFVMCPPKYLSTKIPNNVFMKGQKVDVPRAMAQYERIVRAVRAFGVPVLEIPPVKGCQDQTYVANIGVAIDGDNPVIVLARYKAPGRDCEEEPARKFFEAHGYRVIQPPKGMCFEGEADFKHWKDNIYFGGWGKFSDKPVLDWIAKQTGCQVIPIRETSDELYHLDCSLAVLDPETFLVNRAGMDAASFAEIAKRGNVVEVPPAVMSTGVTNVVQIPGRKILLSGMFFPEMAKYRTAMEWMLKTCDKLGYSVWFVDIDQPDLSGADVSCMVMHLPFRPPHAA
jgi:N-dimethylarginine dimethylaminohydrolase